MHFNEILSFLQQTYPHFIVRDHGAGGHIEMIGETKDQQGNTLLLFGWNEESLSVIRDYRNQNRFLTKDEFLYRDDVEQIWESQYEDCWQPLFTNDYEGNLETHVLTYTLFSEKQVRAWEEWFQQLISLHEKLNQLTYGTDEEKMALLKAMQRSVTTSNQKEMGL